MVIGRMRTVLDWTCLRARLAVRIARGVMGPRGLRVPKGALASADNRPQGAAGTIGAQGLGASRL